MKSIFSLFTLLLALSVAGFALAASDNAGSGSGSSEPMLISSGQGSGNGSVTQERVQEMVRDGNYELADGKTVRVQEMSNNRIQLNAGGVNAETGMKVMNSGDGSALMAQLSNGRNAEIKVMPDVASERALERLRLKSCDSGNCSIELKEVGEGQEARLAYEVKTQKQSRILGMFKKQMMVEAEVDAESGEVIRAGKPWWAFLASEAD